MEKRLSFPAILELTYTTKVGIMKINSYNFISNILKLLKLQSFYLIGTKQKKLQE